MTECTHRWVEQTRQINQPMTVIHQARWRSVLVKVVVASRYCKDCPIVQSGMAKFGKPIEFETVNEELGLDLYESFK